MVTTILALATLIATVFLILGNLRMVARDTFDALTASALRAQADGQILPRAAFAVLWVMIFILSCF